MKPLSRRGMALALLGAVALAAVPPSTASALPTLQATAPTEVEAGSTVEVTVVYGDGADCPARHPTRYSFDWGDRTVTRVTPAADDPCAAAASHAFADAGEYLVVVQALRFGMVLEEDQAGVLVVDAVPLIEPIPDVVAPLGLPATVEILVTDGNDDSASLTVDWGDGSFEGPAGVPLGTVALTHTYTGRTATTATVTVDDGQGGVASASFGVRVVPFCAGLPVTIDGPTSGLHPGESIAGTDGDDVILGTAAADVILGGGGDDTICAGQGDDVVQGGAGNDAIDGGNGDDALYGKGGLDSIRGGSGDDALYGGTGADVLRGSAGNDLLDGGTGSNLLSGGAGEDHCSSTRSTGCESAAVEAAAFAAWKDLARLAVDDSTLPGAFAAAGYGLPAGSEVYLAEIVDGMSGPAYLPYEAGQGAFSTDFWPASTVKLLAAVAAVDTVAGLGFTGWAQLDFADGYSSQLLSIYGSALTVSSNYSYDRLLQVAGLDHINRLAEAHGLDSLVIGTAYTSLPVADPPAYTLSMAGTTVAVTGRTATTEWGENTADLFDLAEVLRRVVLASESPEEERFDLPTADLARLQEDLAEAQPSFFQEGVRRVLGADAVIYHKPGWAWGEECLDHALIVDPSSGRRFLLAATAPYHTGCGALDELAAAALGAVAGDGEATLPAQADAGPTPEVSLTARGDSLDVAFDAEADAARMAIDDGPITVVAGDGGEFAATLALPAAGEHAFRLLLLRDGEPVGSLSLHFEL